MAAVLKKRALAEYSQVLQEEQPKPHKKLRLTKKTPHQRKLYLEQLKTASSAEALQILVQLSESLTLEIDVQPVYRALLEHFHKEQETVVRVKIISLFSQMIQHCSIDASTILDDLVLLLKNETSHKVLAQMFLTLHVLRKVDATEGRIHQRVINLAKQYLSDSSHLVKCACLQIISDFIPIDGQQEASLAILRLLADYSHNHDPRVRSEALLSVLHLHSRGLQLDVSLYDEACKALSDDYEGVRMAALKLVEVFSHLYAEHMVCLSDASEKIRLADDAFARICNMINDLSMNVRVLSASLLGNIKHVSLSFLDQTLDKKLMSNLRKKRSAHERQKENYESGEWATGHKWADDAPREEVDAETVSLISSGACGAFVHGLEDEFLEVRSATLDSLCHLAVCFPSFANLSLDFLVDMFNDEIEEVRLKAIHCLGKISCHIVLREDQLETILSVLEDFSMDIREALHEMLGSCFLSTKAGLKACFNNLLENMKRYPQDKRSIWRCLQKLGEKHPYLALPLVPELLGIHPFFDLPEPDIEDPAYISVLILVFNAAANCPAMMPLFEEHTLKHYSYMRDTLPTVVPHLKLPHNPLSPPEPVSSDYHSSTFLHQILSRVATSDHRSHATRQSLLETAIQDLQRLSQIEPQLSAAANCGSLYIRCQLLFSKILSNKNWLNPSLLCPLQSSSLKSSLEELSRLSFCLSHVFLGLKPEELACLRQLRLRALSLQLLVVTRGSNTSALGLCENFVDQVDILHKFLEDFKIQPDSFTSSVFHDLDALEEPKPGTVARLLQPLLQSFPCPSLHLYQSSENSNEDIDRIKQAGAVIHEPASESDNPLKFTAGLILSVPMDAQIENIEDIKNVRIKVTYPDQQTQLILPRLSDFRQQSELQYRLYTTVLLSHSIWSESCHVDIGLALDFSDAEAISSRGNQKNTSWLKAEENTIELCKSVKVYIAPKPVKKSI